MTRTPRSREWVTRIALAWVAIAAALGCGRKPEPSPATPPGAPAPGPLSTVVVVARLTGGDEIVGSPSRGALACSSALGPLEIPWQKVRRLEVDSADRAVSITLRNGDRINGARLTAPLELTTLLGPVRLPDGRVRNLSAIYPATAWGDHFTDRSPFDPRDSLAEWTVMELGCQPQFLSLATGQPKQPRDDNPIAYTWSFWMRTVQHNQAILLQMDAHRRFPLLVLNKDGSTDNVGRLVWLEDFVEAASCSVLSEPLNDGQWHHVVLRRALSSVGFWIDGRSGSNAPLPGVTHEPVRVRQVRVGAAFEGDLRDLRFYANALDGEEIRRLFHHLPLDRPGQVAALGQPVPWPAEPPPTGVQPAP